MGMPPNILFDAAWRVLVPVLHAQTYAKYSDDSGASCGWPVVDLTRLGLVAGADRARQTAPMPQPREEPDPSPLDVHGHLARKSPSRCVWQIRRAMHPPELRPNNGL